MNIRLWKAKAWEKLGVVKERQRTAMEYNDKLKEKFAAHPEVNILAKTSTAPTCNVYSGGLNTEH